MDMNTRGDTVLIEKFDWIGYTQLDPTVVGGYHFGKVSYDEAWNRKAIERMLTFVDPWHGIHFAVTSNFSSDFEEDAFYINNIACTICLECPYTLYDHAHDDPNLWNCDTIKIRCFVDRRRTEQHLGLPKYSCCEWNFEKSYDFIRKDELLDDYDEFKVLTEKKLAESVRRFCHDIQVWKESHYID